MADSYENVFSLKSAEIEALVGKSGIVFSDLEKLFPLEGVKLGQKVYTGRISPVTVGTRTGTGFVSIESLDTQVLSKTSPVDVKMLFIDSEPLRFKAALGSNGQILDEKHLINTIATPDPTTGQYVVSLIFDSEGQNMFGDITERNAGGVIAIFLGNQLLTAPNVSERIDGNAIITPG